MPAKDKHEHACSQRTQETNSTGLMSVQTRKGQEDGNRGIRGRDSQGDPDWLLMPVQCLWGAMCKKQFWSCYAARQALRSTCPLARAFKMEETPDALRKIHEVLQIIDGQNMDFSSSCPPSNDMHKYDIATHHSSL
jgi:hypothetical protein